MKACSPSDRRANASRVTPQLQSESQPCSRSRRAFIGKMGALTAAGITAAGVSTLPLAARAETGTTFTPTGARQRLNRAFLLRTNAAIQDRSAGTPPHPTNGDEERYPNRIGNYSKGLPHNRRGEVDGAAYSTMLRALRSGDPTDFENITLGGTVLLTNPQSGLAFDMEGLDSHQLTQGPPPALASAERAGEAVEDYWMALLRDVNFTAYESDAGAADAAAELSRLSDFRGPKVGGSVTPGTLFRGFTAGDLIGPYVSQFLLRPILYGAIPLDHRIQTYLPLRNGGSDYMTDASSWLAIQNGGGAPEANRLDPVPRHIRNGRDLAAYVHVDVLFEAYLNACLWLIDNNAPPNAGMPYRGSRTQSGFGTFGAPHVKALLAEVSQRALKAVWYQKWFVHRALRPEEFGGLVHFAATGEAKYPLHRDVMNSEAVARVFSRTGSYFLPHAFPEGCPTHPAYGAGHATVAGACSTIVKAFFDNSFVIPDPVVANDDGTELLPYTGADAGQMTVAGEMNKVAANVGIGRNHAAVHWRSDYRDSLLLGEAVALGVLRDQRNCYNEPLAGMTLETFSGEIVTV
jgi:hypothetical protein